MIHAGDWKHWLDFIKTGSKFLKINKPISLYYENPRGLSTTQEPEIVLRRRKEERQVFEEYREIFPENYKKFKGYFDQWK